MSSKLNLIRITFLERVKSMRSIMQCTKLCEYKKRADTNLLQSLKGERIKPMLLILLSLYSSRLSSTFASFSINLRQFNIHARLRANALDIHNIKLSSQYAQVHVPKKMQVVLNSKLCMRFYSFIFLLFFICFFIIWFFFIIIFIMILIFII